jgi:hypothetical protein
MSANRRLAAILALMCEVRVRENCWYHSHLEQERLLSIRTRRFTAWSRMTRLGQDQRIPREKPEVGFL